MIIVSVIRLRSLDDIANSHDVSFDNLAHAILSAVELNIGIVCACLPATTSLLAHTMPRFFSSAQTTNKSAGDIERPEHILLSSGSVRTNSARTNPPQTHTSQRARSRSNISADSVGVMAPSTPIQGRINPLRLSPVIHAVRSITAPVQLSTISHAALKSGDLRSLSNIGAPSLVFSSCTRISAKPLPITPFPGQLNDF